MQSYRHEPPVTTGRVPLHRWPPDVVATALDLLRHPRPVRAGSRPALAAFALVAAGVGEFRTVGQGRRSYHVMVDDLWAR
jgi:hypothetical protein